MDSKHIYHQLLELFPQVDSRILKAVSIEHFNDCDAAAEFIINEVLPQLSQPSEFAANSTHETREVSCREGLVDPHREKHLSGNVFETVQQESIQQENASLCDSAHVISNSKGKIVEIVDIEPTLDSSSLYILEHLSTPIARDPNNSTSPSSKPERKNIEPIEIIDVEASKYDSHYDLECVGTMSHNSSNSSPVIFKPERGNMAIVEPVEAVNVEQSRVLTHDAKGVGTGVSDVSTDSSTLILNAKGKNIVDFETRCHHSSSNAGESSLPLLGITYLENINTAARPEEHLCNVTPSSSSLQSSHNVIEKFNEFATKDADAAYDDCERHLVRSLANAPEQLEISNDNSLIDKSLPKLLTSRSGHVINIDLLEDCVADAKSSKKDIVNAVESVVNMIKEAELLEERCREAKEEASSAGEEILTKVNELKEMLQRAKQANVMHAGEVFGEKSVLTTEARELQSRLLSLAEEKDKSLSLVDQMRKSLEARMLALRNEIAAAEKEKVEKEGLAVKALEEQEAIMESIVQESKKLKEESDANAKLREFLDDRGRMVDALEGEMRVICEDVISLKRRVDERAPLKGSSLIAPYSASSSKSSSISERSTAFSTSEFLQGEQQILSEMGSEFGFSQERHIFTHNTDSLYKVNAPANLKEKSLSDEDDWEILRNEVGQF